MSLKLRPPVFRFAPSPNGALHLGHAYSALLNADLAAATGGRFLIRIEDIDQTRCTPELEAAMLDDLAWLGLRWEKLIRRQSDHFADYQDALDLLEAEGLIYRSYLTRGDVKAIVETEERDGKSWPRDPDGAPLFPGREFENHATGKDTFSVRLDMARAIKKAGDLFWIELDDGGKQREVKAAPEKWGDVVLARRDTPTSYHLSVVVDDALQKISHVVRGLDLYHATSVHVLLQKLLGLPHPVYRHHMLILDEDGRKLSKSRGDTSLAHLRARGLTPEDIRRKIGINID